MDKNKVTLMAVALTVILCVLFAGCMGADNGDGQTITPPPSQTPEIPGTVGESEETIAAANNNFAFSLYKTLAAEDKSGNSNIFYSPFSISSAFALVYEGAKDKTADEIASVFFFPESVQTLRNGYQGINAGINSENPAYSLSVANALWAEENYSFLDEYINNAKLYYSADTINLDFINQPEESRLTINKWAEDKTSDKIKDLLPDGTINSLTRLVVTNAVYFKGTWVLQFDSEKTHEADFVTSSGDTVKVDMMQRTDDDAIYCYSDTDSLKALKMPYESDNGDKLSMIVLLPKDNDIKAAEDVLDLTEINGIENSMESKQVRVFFPKFKLETEYSLSDTLKEMGMPVAFTGDADFSGMDGTKNLAISDVVHKAYVDVNEEGTEAAAATAVTIGLTAVVEEEPVPVFRADHPFIFLIQEDATGNILFMGRVCNPA